MAEPKEISFKIICRFRHLIYPVRHPNHVNISTLVPHLEGGEKITIFLGKMIDETYLIIERETWQEHGRLQQDIDKQNDSRVSRALEARELRHVENQPR